MLPLLAKTFKVTDYDSTTRCVIEKPFQWQSVGFEATLNMEALSRFGPSEIIDDEFHNTRH